MLASTPSLQTVDKPANSPSHCSIATPPRTVYVTVENNESDGTVSDYAVVTNGPLSANSLELTNYLSQFQTRCKKAVIDVYWLFDDGGHDNDYSLVFVSTIF